MSVLGCLIAGYWDEGISTVLPYRGVSYYYVLLYLMHSPADRRL